MQPDEAGQAEEMRSYRTKSCSRPRGPILQSGGQRRPLHTDALVLLSPSGKLELGKSSNINRKVEIRWSSRSLVMFSARFSSAFGCSEYLIQLPGFRWYGRWHVQLGAAPMLKVPWYLPVFAMS